MANIGGITGIALTVAGTGAIIASGFFTGGVSWGLLGAGLAASMGGSLLASSAAAEQPEPISQVARQLATTSDPETPWDWVYGTVVKGGVLAWTGIAGDQDQWIGGDIVLACHACDAVLELQVGDWTFPIVTSIDGDTNYNGVGLILNTGLAVDPYTFPADWYVPVTGGVNGKSQWWRNPQDDNNTDDRAHIGVKFYYGTQTVTDSYMVTRFGTKYSSVARKFIGHTVMHIILRAHTELGTLGALPEITVRMRGKKDIQDYTGGDAAYRNNCAYVFADYCREHFGIPVTDIVGINASQTLQGVAAECDDTTWSGAGGAARYAFDGVIRDDMEPIDALNLIAEHMAGGYSERGDQIAIYTGTVKTAWSGGPFTDDDLAGDNPILIMPPDQDSWANTIVPHFVVQRPNDENGQRVLHGAMEPAKVDVTSATYVTEDQGQTFRQDAKFQACILGRRAKWLAWIVLKQMRLGASATFRLKKRASVLERGDVFTTSMPVAGFFPNNTKWQVAGKRMLLGPDTFAVEIDAVRYEDAIYTPDTTPTEDAIGIVPRNHSTLMPLITGLAADELEDSGQVNARGRLVIDVVVSWNLVANILVRSAGNVRIAWKRQSASTWKSATAAGDEIQTVIPGLRQGVAYHIRARAEGEPSAGRTNRPRGAWSSNLSFTPDSGDDDLPGGPGSGVEGSNQVINGKFERGDASWDLNVAGSTAPGFTATIESTGGKHGPHMLVTAMSPSAAEQFGRVRNDSLIPVAAGQWCIMRLAVKKEIGTDTFNAKLVLLFYGTDGTSDFITGIDTMDIPAVSWTTWPAARQTVRFQVPGDPDIVWAQVECRMESNASGTAEGHWDGITFQPLTVMRSTRTSTEVEVSDDTWTNLFTLDGFDGVGDPETSIYFDGETEVEIEAVVEASVKRDGANDIGSGGAVNNCRAVARLRLEEVGVGTTSIVTQLLITAIRPGDVNAGASGEIDQRVLSTEVTPTVGEYKIHLEGRAQGDFANGTAEFFERRIRVWKT